jgi:hypothetical protein
MVDNRFTFNVQRLPAGPSYAESFQDQNSYGFILLFFSIVIFEESIRVRTSSRHDGGAGQIKRVGTDVIEDLLRGKKNPVQCLNEYCSMTKKTIVYTETGSGYRYANYATIDNVQFPQVRRN